MKLTLKILVGIAGIWLGLMGVLELVLSQSVLSRLIDKYSAEYIDGELDFGNVSISMFKRFPCATLTLEDFSITYPADRFDQIENLGAQGHLIKKGCGQESDTLAYFKKFSAAINISAMLPDSKIMFIMEEFPFSYMATILLFIALYCFSSFF